jgi:hypothetical protein
MAVDSDLAKWVLTAIVVVVLGPLDVLGAGGVPLAPDKVLLALGAIWGVDALGSE